MKCPLRQLNNTHVFLGCVDKDCAWWVNDKCAIAVLAETALPVEIVRVKDNQDQKWVPLEQELTAEMEAADIEAASSPSYSLGKAEARGRYSGLFLAREKIHKLLAKDSHG